MIIKTLKTLVGVFQRGMLPTGPWTAAACCRLLHPQPAAVKVKCSPSGVSPNDLTFVTSASRADSRLSRPTAAAGCRTPRSLLTLALLSTSSLSAGIVHSGFVNLPIPTTFAGIYLDVDTGATNTTEFTGWDVNFAFGGSEIYNSDKFQAVRTGTGNSDAFKNMVEGFQVAAGTSFFSTDFGGSITHLGFGADQFAPSTEGYLGFKFTTNGNAGPYYGWMHVTLTGNTAGGVIHDWAYENTGQPILVPEPATYAVLAGVLAIGVAVRRRRRLG